MRRLVVVLLMIALVALLGMSWSSLAFAHEDHLHTPSPRPANTVTDQPPLVGVLAGLAILVAGLAGIFIYRVIREGL